MVCYHCVTVLKTTPDHTPSPPRVLIVDDHPIVLYGLRFVLGHNGRFAVCGEAADANAARAFTRDLHPDYIILDLVLGGRDGIDLVRDLVTLAPHVRILIYSSQNEWRYARRVLAAGAKGYVAKSEGLDVVAGALDVLARGEDFVGDGLRRQLLDDFILSTANEPGSAMLDLSARELQVLTMIGQGHGLGEIATALDLSVKTIGTYRERLKVKLGVERVSDLAFVARERMQGR